MTVLVDVNCRLRKKADIDYIVTRGKKILQI